MRHSQSPWNGGTPVRHGHAGRYGWGWRHGRCPPVRHSAPAVPARHLSGAVFAATGSSCLPTDGHRCIWRHSGTGWPPCWPFQNTWWHSTATAYGGRPAARPADGPAAGYATPLRHAPASAGNSPPAPAAGWPSPARWPSCPVVPVHSRWWHSWWPRQCCWCCRGLSPGCTVPDSS